MALTKKDYEGIQTEIHEKSLYTLYKYFEDKPILLPSMDSHPTKRPNGQKLVNGDMYINTNDEKIYVYENGIWVETVSTQKTNQLPSFPDKTFDVQQGYYAGNVYHYNSYSFLLLNDTPNSAIWAYYFGDTPQSNNIEPTGSIEYYFDYMNRVMYHSNGSEWIDISTPANAEHADRATYADTANIAINIEGVDKNDIHTHNNKDILDHLGANSEGKLTFNGNQVDTVIAQRDVYDGLDSYDSTISLSANMGRVLNENKADKTTVIQSLEQKLDKSDVYDGLDSSSSSLALSARQGKVLNDAKADRSELHSHSNKTILDKLSEDSNGELLYNGTVVGGDSGINLPVNSDSEKILVADANNNLSWKKIDDELAVIDTEDGTSSTEELILVRVGNTVIWKKKSEIEGTTCYNYKCKIILNKTSQGLSLIIVDSISLALENNTDSTLGIIVNNEQEENIDSNTTNTYSCLDSVSVISTYQLPVLDIEIDNLSYSLLAQDTFRETVTNKTDIALEQSVDGSNWTNLDADATTEVGTNIYINNPNTSLYYTEPTRPTQPTPAHYSNMEANLVDYGILVTATSDEDVDIVNKTSDIIKILDAQNNNELSSLNVDDDYVAQNDIKITPLDGIYKTYQEPTRPPIPTPAHYSEVELHLIDYGISLTATTDEDANIVNKFTDNIKIFKASDDSQLSDLATDGSYVVTDNVKITPNDGIYKTYTEPTRPSVPIPEHYSEVTITAISDNIDITASDEYDCNIINQTDLDIKVGNTTLPSNSNIVITENTTITLQ